jgi:CBS domain-containing protein
MGQIEHIKTGGIMPTLTARDIMTQDVLTVAPEMSVKEFAQFLLAHHISGAPVVAADGSLAGLATETDVIFRDAAMHLPTVITLLDAYFVLENPRKHDQELHKILGGKVEDIMTREVVTIAPEATLGQMATLMQERRRHLLPVLAAGRLVGVVGKADLVRAIAQEE